MPLAGEIGSDADNFLRL